MKKKTGKAKEKVQGEKGNSEHSVWQETEPEHLRGWSERINTRERGHRTGDSGRRSLRGLRREVSR